MPKSTEKRFIVITGDSTGIGNAATEAILNRSPDVRVIGISRRAVKDISHNLVGRFSAERFHHISADLSNPADVSALPEEIMDRIRFTRGKIIALIHAAGALEIGDGTSGNDYERMLQVNAKAPCTLTSLLLYSSKDRTHFTDETPHSNANVIYVSSLAAHNNAGTAMSGLRSYINTKRKAEIGLGVRALHGHLKIVYPGAYYTDMVDRHIRREDAPLEWYASQPADPYKKGGIADMIARRALTPAERGPSVIACPWLAANYVTHMPQWTQRKLLATMIRLNAAAVLEQTGQTLEDHDARVDYHAERKSYGRDFPYHKIISSRLWPRANRAQNAVLNMLGLI